MTATILQFPVRRSYGSPWPIVVCRFWWSAISLNCLIVFLGVMTT